MTSTITILGKKRKLVGTFGNYFLAEAKDVLTVGIYHALPLHLWRDEHYLNKIRARKGARGMRLQTGKYELRITKYWYGLYHCKVIRAFSLGFIHFIRKEQKR